MSASPSCLPAKSYIPETSDPLLPKALPYLWVARCGIKGENGRRKPRKETGSPDRGSLSPIITSVYILSFRLDHELLEGRDMSFIALKFTSQIIAC